MMTELTDREKAFIAAQRVARLATVDEDGRPHAVPICFAFDEQTGLFYSALDEKPKRVPPQRLRRIRNIQANPSICLVMDVYDDTDWSRLAYVQVRGIASVLLPGAAEHEWAVALLRRRYRQYETMAIEENAVVRIVPQEVRSWGAL